LSMLYSYYDCTQSHKFQSLFGNLLWKYKQRLLILK
jgi:hypothetical protein